MAKKMTGRRKNKKRAARPKARPRKSVARKKKTTRSRAKAGHSRGSQLSRGLDSSRAALIPESEPERTLEAGQSGDTEGLSDVEDADSESVEELAEEGQDYEAEIVSGVERAADRQGKEVRTDVEEEERPRPRRRTL
jgi:hypothetical protein